MYQRPESRSLTLVKLIQLYTVVIGNPMNCQVRLIKLIRGSSPLKCVLKVIQRDKDNTCLIQSYNYCIYTCALYQLRKAFKNILNNAVHSYTMPKNN